MLYLIARWIFLVLVQVIYRFKVTGLGNVPKHGGLIVASNHTSVFDPILVGCALNRKVAFMAKDDLFRNRIFGFALRKVGAFPVRRGAQDYRAFKECLQILKEGKVLGVFPEGSRSPDGKLQSAYSGTAVLARKMAVPILPVGVIGSSNMLRKDGLIPRFGARVEVRIGKPLTLFQGTHGEVKERSQQMSDWMMREIANLIGESAPGG